MCGGTLLYANRENTDTGLSPRVRGNLVGPASENGPKRSIPACAGEPDGEAAVYPIAGVYPRVCGGTFLGVAVLGAGAGLSPRVRGNRYDSAWAMGIARSIPACAGEPREHDHAAPAKRVYPRVCGGTSAFSDAVPVSGGLSPRVRGNHRPQDIESREERSIPACAGEPAWMRLLSGRLAVYPRVCGGTEKGEILAVMIGGLSPRVRGNPDVVTPVASAAGSIPACAGEPCCGGPAARKARVYPRVCGGTAIRKRQSPARGGLSPRVRGNPAIGISGY